MNYIYTVYYYYTERIHSRIYSRAAKGGSLKFCSFAKIKKVFFFCKNRLHSRLPERTLFIGFFFEYDFRRNSTVLASERAVNLVR